MPLDEVKYRAFPRKFWLVGQCQHQVSDTVSRFDLHPSAQRRTGWDHPGSYLQVLPITHPKTSINALLLPF